MNNLENIKKIVTEFQDMIIKAATGTTVHPAEYEQKRNDLLSEVSIRHQIPEFVIISRDLKVYWNFIKQISPNYQGRRNFIYEKFNKLFYSIENESFEPIDLELQPLLTEIDINSISDIWKKAIMRKEVDPSGSITAAKSFIETVCKYILDERSIKYTEKENIAQLYKKTARVLQINTKPELNQTMLKIYSGCISVIVGVSTLRNKIGDAHGKGVKYKKPDKKYAGLAIGLAGAMAIFLIKKHKENEKLFR